MLALRFTLAALVLHCSEMYEESITRWEGQNRRQAIDDSRTERGPA